MITIVDYGMGNLRSVQKACEKLEVEATFATTPEEIARAEKLILPGVGAFRDAIGELREKHLVEPIRERCQLDKPTLGICLGMQLLFDRSFEDGNYEGLGIVPGEVVRFPEQPGLKVPHMGWNALSVQKKCPLFADIPDDSYVYFVHSYHVVPTDGSVTVARTEHGVPFTSVIQQGALFATQFHPEKSQKVGLQMLTNFINL